MVNKCSAYGCTSGYKSHETGESVSFHAFPVNNTEILDKWMRANPRKDFAPTKYSRMCSLHFKPIDFVQHSTDSNSTRRRDKCAGELGDRLVRRFLKADAVPSVFPNAAKYLSMTSPASRSTVNATSARRQQQDAERYDMMEQSFHASDDISALTVTELAEKLKSESTVPDGYTIIIKNSSLLICWLEVGSNMMAVLKSCIVINFDLTIVVSLDGKAVPAAQYGDLCKGPIQLISQLVNIMARVKSWIENVSSRSLKLNVQLAITALEDGLETLNDTTSDQHREISFILEQLKLVLKDKYGRHYSPQLTIMSFMIYASSNAAYKTLLKENVLCLPSISTLKKVVRRVDSTSGLNNTASGGLRGVRGSAAALPLILCSFF